MQPLEKKLIELFEWHFKEVVNLWVPVKVHASYRKLYRLASANRSVIGVANSDRAENIAFLEFSRHFRKIGLPVPEIYVEDLNNGLYLEEDLGDLTLYEALTKARAGTDDLPAEVEVLYKKVVRILPKFQIEGGKGLNYGLCYPRSSYDDQSIRWDLNYFKYNFLKLAGASRIGPVPFNEQKLEEDFQELIAFLMEADSPYFLYRDFQSRNILLREDSQSGQLEPFFIDYQGGRRGALQYDIASLLTQAKANLPLEARKRLLEEYLEALEAYIPVDREVFIQHYQGFVLIRVLQTLGTYGLKGLHERKPYFLQSLPYALHHLKQFLNTVQLPIKLPELMNVLDAIVSAWDRREKSSSKNRLTVRVLSFSYHSSLPLDETEHGGGFVFDCRCLPNPGREAIYKKKSGLDAEVVEYLRKIPAVDEFLKHCFALVDQAVEAYILRKFTHLMICFGCTGGQHRSVYAAECLARHLREKYEVDVDLQHRELERMNSL